MSSTELEVKLEIDADVAHGLPDKLALRRMALGHWETKKLQSTYYDTADHRLRSQNASLRIRWDGTDWIQTLKYGTGVAHGVSNPIEIESVLKEPQLDLDGIDDPGITPCLSDILTDGPLIPVFETEFNRDTHLLRSEGIGTVELAIDNGEVRNRQKTAAINEVELEFKSGMPMALLNIAESLFENERIKASTTSKAERGYALTQEPSTSVLCPHVDEKPVLARDLPADQAFKATGRSAAGKILDNWNLLSVSDDPEAPHQLRIGLRRLRSCLRIFRSFLTSNDLRILADEARDMGRLIGLVRNADVLHDDIAVPAIKALGRNRKHSAMLDYLKHNQQLQRQSVREAISGERWTHLKLNCMLFDQAIDRAFFKAGVPPADESVKAVSRRELEKAWRRVKNRGRGFSNHRIEERHEMRKTLKTMRYASEYFLQLYPGKDAASFFKKLRRLQDVFGYLNDVAMVEQLATTIADEHPDRKDLQDSVAKILNWHRDRAKSAMRKADRRWRSLKASRKFWQV